MHRCTRRPRDPQHWGEAPTDGRRGQAGATSPQPQASTARQTPCFPTRASRPQGDMFPPWRPPQVALHSNSPRK